MTDCFQNCAIIKVLLQTRGNLLYIFGKIKMQEIFDCCRKRMVQKSHDECQIPKTFSDFETVFIGERNISKVARTSKEYRRRNSKYPTLELLARKCFSAPPSAISDERLLSELGNVYHQKRSILLPQNGEKQFSSTII